ncbi:MAG: hypothetical protein V4598_07435 [Bdellovibrionota bacterium]
MKYFLVLLALSTSVFAARMPEKIICTSKATSEVVRAFSLIDLNTLHPNATIEDGGFMGFELRDGVLSMGISNECDNSYEISLPIHELEEMIEGKRKSVTGKLVYSDVALSEARNTEEAVEETVEINCRLK